MGDAVAEIREGRDAYAPAPRGGSRAVVEFLATALVEQSHRVGKPLRGQLEGIFSARRGTYRVLYEIVSFLAAHLQVFLMRPSGLEPPPRLHRTRPST